MEEVAAYAGDLAAWRLVSLILRVVSTPGGAATSYGPTCVRCCLRPDR